MPGFEVFGNEEQQAINELFEINGGILFAHGFDALRKGAYRVRELEAAFCEVLGCRFAQAVSSGTAALKVALKALGVGPGDEVITQSFTFVATVEAIVDCGATPVIADINETFNLDPADVKEKITPRTKVIIPVHMAGVPAQMEEIMALAQSQGIKVLEDTAQGLGGSYRGVMMGTLGDAGIFSLDFGKVITTGEGGMVVTNNEEVYLRARSYHDHGHEYNQTLPRGRDNRVMPGFNYRMTEVQGAIGLAQIKKLESIIARQRENKAKMVKGLEGLNVHFRNTVDAGECGDTIIIFFDSQEQAQALCAALGEQGLGTKNVPDAMCWHFAGFWEHIFSGYPQYQGQDLFKLWGKSYSLLTRTVALPVMVNMDDERIQKVISAVRRSCP